MTTRSRLMNILTPEDINRFKPNVVLCEEAKKQREQGRKSFYSTLMDIIASHRGEQLLVIRRRYVVCHGVESLRAHFYLGLISSQLGDLVLASDGVALPTSRYVDKLNSSHSVSRSNGGIPESVLGADAVWLFFFKFGSEQYALDFFIGDEEVDTRISGTFPYLHQDMLSALGYPPRGNENLPLQFESA